MPSHRQLLVFSLLALALALFGFFALDTVPTQAKVSSSISLTSLGSPYTENFDTLEGSALLADQYLADGVQFFGTFSVANYDFNGALTVPSPPNFFMAKETFSTRSGRSPISCCAHGADTAGASRRR